MGRNTLKIEWLSDSTDCETCGPSWAEGATVTLNGEELFTRQPLASCYYGYDYDERAIFDEILNKLGYDVEHS